MKFTMGILIEVSTVPDNRVTLMWLKMWVRPSGAASIAILSVRLLISRNRWSVWSDGFGVFGWFIGG